MRLTQGVIFDLAGTLVEGTGARAQAWAEALRAHGHDRTYDSLCKLVGLVPCEVLVRTTGLGLDTDEGRAIYAEAQRVFKKRLLHRLQPSYRAAALVERVRACGLRVAVSSFDPPDVVRGLLRTAGVEAPFQRAGGAPTGADAVSNREVIKDALDRLGATPPHVLMVASTPYDVAAASQLNIPVIALRSGRWRDADLYGARAIYDDVTHLLRELDTSPIAEMILNGQRVVV